MRHHVVPDAFHRIDRPRLKHMHERLSARVCNERSIPRKGFARLSGAVHELKDEPFMTVWLHDEVGPLGVAVVLMNLNP